MYFVASSSWAEWKAKRWWSLLNCSASFAVWGKNVEWVDFWCYGRWNPSFCIENCDACFRKSAAKVFKDVNCETIPLCSNFPLHCWHFSNVQFLSPQHLIDGHLGIAIVNNLQVPLENNWLAIFPWYITGTLVSTSNVTITSFTSDMTSKSSA